MGTPRRKNNELILKSDGEPAIVAVRERLSRYHGGKITPEQPPKGESSSNGKVEEAGKTTRSLAKVFKDMIEFKIGEEIQSDCAIMLWLVRWVAMMYSRFKVGTDGRTAYERQKGRKCKQEVIPFAEKVMYKKLKESGARKQILESQWEEGLWLGHSRTCNEVLIGTYTGVVRAWAVKRKTDEDRWDKALIKTLAKPDPTTSGTEIPTIICLPKAEDEEDTK